MQPPRGDERVSRLLERHPAVLASPESCQRLAELLKARRGGGDSGRLLGSVPRLAWRLLLLYAFCTVSLHCLENTFPAASYQWRTGRALSYLNLVYLKSYRWLTVRLGLYRSEFVHSRDREACLVPNPLHRPPVMCCGCQLLPAPLPRIRLNNPAGRDAFRLVVDRHVTPFLVTDSGHRTVTYAELRRTVLDAWEEVNSGSNRISNQHPADGVGPATLSELLLPEGPPATRLTSWTYGHMSAIRAMRRRLVPRPPFVRPDVDFGFARAFYLLAGAPAEDASLGDLSQFHGVAILLGLHGSLRVTLGVKPECCPGNAGGGVHSNVTAVLGPGQALVVPSQCYQVHVARAGGGEGYALAHLFSVFSSTGIIQAAPITGRVPVTDDVADDY